jgi:hypothetical protein
MAAIALDEVKVPVPLKGWKTKDVSRSKITEVVLKKFGLLVKDYEQRKVQAENDYTVIKRGGFWFSSDVFRILQQREPLKDGKQPLMELFRNSGAFLHGYAPLGFTLAKADPERSKNPATDRQAYRYILTSKIPADEALQRVKTSLNFFECQSLIELVYYETLLEVWGT